jgi:predicted phage-related endonuclease
MPEYIKDIPQGSEEWHALRIGSIGGTGLDSVLAKGQGKQRQSYLYQLAAEILSGQKTDTFTTPAMLRGIELEDDARQYYSFVTGNVVEQVTMIKADIPRVHHSPDGLVGDDGGIEIKTMLPHTYIELVDTEKIPLKYIRQCQHFLWISCRKWIDFAAYCPEIKSRPMWIGRLTPDEKMFSEIEKEIPLFLAELESLVKKIGGHA